MLSMAVAVAVGVVAALAAGGDDAHRTDATIAANRLTWAPPALVRPRTIVVNNGNANLRLDPRRDYIIKLSARPLAVAGGLSISGGHNVVLKGGQTFHEAWTADSALTRVAGDQDERRCAPPPS
jgi:hypothetical protein